MKASWSSEFIKIAVHKLLFLREIFGAHVAPLFAYKSLIDICRKNFRAFINFLASLQYR
jgi:hypothetical protein